MHPKNKIEQIYIKTHKKLKIMINLNYYLVSFLLL